MNDNGIVDVLPNNLVGYCKAKQAYITQRQLKQHHCLRVKTNKPCKNFDKIDGIFWERRTERKQLAKEKRKELRK